MSEATSDRSAPQAVYTHPAFECDRASDVLFRKAYPADALERRACRQTLQTVLLTHLALDRLACPRRACVAAIAAPPSGERTRSRGSTYMLRYHSGTMAVQGISGVGIVLRVALAIALVLVTFNPTGHSFYHWFVEPPLGLTPVKSFLGVGLLIAWVVCLRTAYVALGALGLVLGCLLLGSFAWMLFDMDVLHADGRGAMVWMGLIVFGAVLGFGLSWSLIRARATGQIEVQ